MGIIVLLALLFFVNEFFYKRIAIRHPHVSIKLIKKIFLYHLLFALIYYIYASYNASDSKYYHNTLRFSDMGWLDTIPMTNWGVFFIEYPFILQSFFQTINILFLRTRILIFWSFLKVC